MDVLDAIFARRSVRKYQQTALSEAQIDTLLRAAQAAPSTVDNRDWYFMVLRERKNLDIIIDLKAGGADMLKEAPLAIMVCGDLNLAYKSRPDYWIQDCSAATQNILLAATGMGLGSVWLGVYPNMERVEALQKAFQLPDHLVPLCVVAVGYPAEEKQPNARYEAEKVYFDCK